MPEQSTDASLEASMASASKARASFFPKADAAVLRTQYAPTPPEARPRDLDVLDLNNANKALECWDTDVADNVYPQNPDAWGPALIPDKKSVSSHVTGDYLFPMLAPNERLRLTMLYYYTRGFADDDELVSRIQEKVHIAQEQTGWDIALVGLLDHNTFTRVSAVGIPLAVLPRRESPCSHTINQSMTKVFNVNSMTQDWRFEKSPYVEKGGLRAYVGVPLRFESEFGEHVAFGSLCVASKSEQPPLTIAQQTSLAHLADWIVGDIVHSARVRRQTAYKRKMELLAAAQTEMDETLDITILDMLRQAYPGCTVGIHTAIEGQIAFEGGLKVPVKEIHHGLWEDVELFEYLLEKLNHQDPVASRVVRFIAAQCVSQRVPTFLVVGTNDYRDVFDDVDSSFVHMAAETLNRGWQNRALKEALAAKDNFLRGMTHQLRTPIHGILGSIELLDEELGAREPASPLSLRRRASLASNPEANHKDPKTYIRSIRRSAHELISTVNSLIDLNRWADIARTDRSPALHSINSIETNLLQELQTDPDQLSDMPSLIFNNHLPPDSNNLMLDMRLFMDCIRPLIINAIQAAGEVVCVTMSLSEDSHSLIVDIEDTGQGIPSEDRVRIFSAHEKVSPHTTGAGLGLTLSSKIATIMDGVVTLVSSELGKGSHFRATFTDIACACTPPKELRGAARHALNFHMTDSFPSEASLTHYFSQYLLCCGHVKSPEPKDSILIFNYHDDHLNRDQVGICLVPDSAYVPFMGEHAQLHQESKTIYIQGPFTSALFEDALDRAQALQSGSGTENTLEGTIPSQPPVEAFQSTISVDDPLSHTRNHASPPLVFSESHPKNLPESLSARLCDLQLQTAQLPPADKAKEAHNPMTLLVDDNAINLQFLEMYCRRRSIPHCAATDGLEAIQLYTTHATAAYSSTETSCTSSTIPAPTDAPTPITVVLMDLQMPNCDGLEATRQIRRLEAEHGWPRAVIAIVTGQDSIRDRASAKEAGADEFFVKPVGPKVLDRKVREWFPGSRV